MSSIYSILNNSIQKSLDGTTWSSVSTEQLDNAMNFVVISENLMFITKPDSNYQNSELYKSINNGQTWTKINFTNITNIYDIKYNGSYILVSGDNGRVAKSLDGNSWNEYIVSSNKTSSKIINIGWNGTTWMAILYDDSSYSSTSSDGVIWSTLSLIVSGSTYSSYFTSYKGDVHYYNGNWLYISGGVDLANNNGKLQKSSNNGNTWSQIVVSPYTLNMISSNNNFVLIIGPGGNLYKTSDLINFTNQYYGTQFNGSGGIGLKNIKFFNNEFYLFGVNGSSNSIIYKSSTGDNFNLIYTFNGFEIYNTYIYTPTGPTGNTEPTGNTGPNALPCLVKGMEVNVENGIKKIEDLQVGDTVVDILGRKIRASEILCKKVIGDNNNIPYVIPKDFFEKDIPSKDIYISYNHAYFYNGQWMLPIHNDDLKRDETFLGKEIEYYHVSLPNYAVDKLVCYNLPVDSFDNSKYNQENMI